MTHAAPDFLLVMIEDDEGHARLIEKNLRRAEVHNELVHLSDGNAAIDYFFGGQISRPTRILILLDLNLPGVDGYEILKRLKSDPETRILPVIVLTTTADPQEISRCYDLGCNIYMSKPVEYEDFSTAIRQLGNMLSVVQIPSVK